MGAVYTSYRIRHSKFGLGLRAISQDETKAEVAGIPTSLYKILAFAISGLFVGMAGGLWGYYLTYLRPTIFLNIIVAAKLVLMSVLGGKGTVSGPVVGAFIFIGQLFGYFCEVIPGPTEFRDFDACFFKHFAIYKKD